MEKQNLVCLTSFLKVFFSIVTCSTGTVPVLLLLVVIPDYNPVWCLVAKGALEENFFLSYFISKNNFV